jgi:hypothetical protein
MKYILLMTGTKAGVEHYRTWAPKDIDTHMAGLGGLVLDLHQSGELVAEQGLTGPDEAMVVCGLKNGMPITDGIFPESKEFLLGYWIVDLVGPRPGRDTNKHAHRSAEIGVPPSQLVITGSTTQPARTICRTTRE